MGTLDLRSSVSAPDPRGKEDAACARDGRGVAGPEEMEEVRRYIRVIADHSLAGTATGAVLETVLGSCGKMIRPRLLLLCSGFGPRRERRVDRLLLLAAMVELTHMASLVHDDIVDDARFRRGLPSVQGRFGKDAAVYAGDFLISRVNYWLAREGLSEASMLLSETIERMCRGEIGQASCRFQEDVTAEQYLDNTGGKTASLFSAACTLGARESGCDGETAERLGRLGTNIGMMFQLRDDLLDYTSTATAEGKETHRDFCDGIYTLPLIRAMSSPEGRKQLLPLLRRNLASGLDSAGLHRLEELVERFGGIAAAQEAVHGYARECFVLLDSLAENESRERIRTMIKKLDAT